MTWLEWAHKERPPCCMPWDLWWIEGDLTGSNKVTGLECCRCKREIAVKASYMGKRCLCIYCGIDLGLITEDVPLFQEPK